MVDPLTWVLTGIGAYWLALLWLDRSGRLPEFIGTQGPIITVHTQRGRAFLEQLARSHPRFLQAWGNFGLGIALVVMVGSFLFLLLAALATFQNPTPSAVNEPRNVLVIPGVNDFLPLAATPEILLGLLIGLVVHEGGHGLYCRVGDIDIKSMGIALFAVLPIGAFVEPDDDSRRAADRGDQTRMFAAGVTNNFAITIIAFALLFGPVAGSISVAPGAAVGAVLPGSAAEDAGIGQGDRIVAVGGTPVANDSALDAQLATLDDRTVTVGLGDGREVAVTRSLLVTGITQGSPFAGTVDVGTTIVAVDGRPIYTAEGLRDAVADQPVATLETQNGSSVTGPVGSYVRVREGGPAAESGLPSGESIVITAVGGTRVVDATSLGTALEDTTPNQTVEVTYFVDDERQTEDVRLGP
ncbi:MAG: site-2 protease family protein, partial [Halobacteriales archaeon]|nr:site-2 protease family protein [Halobacteriales archaeon]